MLQFRDASMNDIPFLVDTIIEAEKSGTCILSYTTMFGLSEKRIRKYLASMLEEEVDGFELSISSFMLAEDSKEPVGSAAVWIEGETGLSSNSLKGNLMSFVLPASAIERALKYNKLLNELQLDHFNNSLQLGVVYVVEKCRGQKVCMSLIDRQIEKYRDKKPTAMFVQVFGNNKKAIKAYEKAGFSICQKCRTMDKDAQRLLPHNVKILMKKDLEYD